MPARPHRFRLAPMLLIACLLLPTSFLPAQPFEHDAFASPITGRPALSEEAIETFIRVNRLAEPRRQKAIEDWIADARARQEDPASDEPEPPHAMGDVLRGMLHAQSGIEEEACREAGVPLAVWRETRQRILQVDALLTAELRIAAIDHELAQIEHDENRDPRELALEAAQGMLGVRRATLEGERARLNEHIATLEVSRDRKEANRRENAAARAQSARKKIDADDATLEKLRGILAERHALLDDPRWQPQHEAIRTEIEEIETLIVKIESKQAKRRERSDEAEAAAAGNAPSSRPTSESIGIDRASARLLEIEEELQSLETEATSEEALARWERDIQQGLAQRRAKLESEKREFADLLKTPFMEQARLDEPAVTPRASALIENGSSLVPAIAVRERFAEMILTPPTSP